MPEPSVSIGLHYLRLVGLGVVIGIPAAVVAALYLALVHVLQHYLWHTLPAAIGHATPPWYLIVGLPTVGAAVTAAARRFLPGDGGHRPLDGLKLTPTALTHVPGIAVAATASLAFGAVLGPEAPVIALGSAVAVAITARVRITAQENAVVSTAGGFSAISALFGGPIVAGVLLVEGGIGIGTALLPALLPGLVAAAVGYLIFVGFGNWGGLNAPGLVVPHLANYHGVHLTDLVIGLVVGVLAAILLSGVHRAGSGIAGLQRRLGLVWLLCAGGLAIGVLALVSGWLGADSQDVLFSGQASIPALIATGSTKILVVLLVAKVFAYAISLGSGFRGGPIFPAIFVGIGLADFAVVWFHTSPTLAVAVGAAAGMAAQTKLLFSPLILAALLVGSAGLDAVPVAVIAAAAAWLTATGLSDAPA